LIDEKILDVSEINISDTDLLMGRASSKLSSFKSTQEDLETNI
jgi:hypothetical protein